MKGRLNQPPLPPSHLKKTSFKNPSFIRVNVCINKEDIIQMSEYFSKPSGYSRKNITVELDLCNCATKSDFEKQHVLVPPT